MTNFSDLIVSPIRSQKLHTQEAGAISLIIAQL